MALTRRFTETVRARAMRDPDFRVALLEEAARALLGGDVAAGRSALRDYINATIGFESLAETTGTPAKSLMRMFGPRGNPTAANLFAVIHALQERSEIRLNVVAMPIVPELRRVPNMNTRPPAATFSPSSPRIPRSRARRPA